MKYLQVLLVCTVFFGTAAYAQGPNDIMRALETPSAEELIKDEGPVRPVVNSEDESKMSRGFFQVFPNPTRDGESKVVLRDLVAGKKQVAVNVLDTFGNVIRSERMVIMDTAFEYSLSTNSVMKPGAYHVNVVVNDQTYHQRWMVQ